MRSPLAGTARAVFFGSLDWFLDQPNDRQMALYVVALGAVVAGVILWTT